MSPGMPTKVIPTENGTVVIQINPQMEENRIFDDRQETEGTYHNTTLKKMLKVQPKSLGTVQIMIGVLTFLMGIIHTISMQYWIFHRPTAFSGVTYWGSLIYISTGSLSVAAENKLNPCVVKASLGMNVFSAISAGIAILFMSIDVFFGACYYNNHSNCLKLKGIFGILLVFSILQFIISICISAFACKTSCNRDSTVVNVLVNTAR